MFSISWCRYFHRPSNRFCIGISVMIVLLLIFFVYFWLFNDNNNYYHINNESRAFQYHAKRLTAARHPPDHKSKRRDQIKAASIRKSKTISEKGLTGALLRPDHDGNMMRLNSEVKPNEEIVIVSVICGKAVFEEALVLIKSAIISHKSSALKFILYVDEILLQRELAIKYVVPADIKRFIYLDTDIIILDDLSHIWNHFHLMNSVQLIGAILTYSYKECAPWYPKRLKKKPKMYKTVGINAGVLLFNLERKIDWIHDMVKIKREAKYLQQQDQEMLNIYFYKNPDRIFLLSCAYNYRLMSAITKKKECGCKDAEMNGPFLIHGITNSFKNNVYPPISIIHSVFKKYELGTNIEQNLWLPLRTRLANQPESHQKVFVRGVKKRLGMNPKM